jgi:D-alanyl-D-alanine carboxypeptidase (penicillin-binding protein 5/6)
MTYGFRYFETHKLYDAGQAISEARVWSGREDVVNLGITEEVVATIPRGQAEQLQASLSVEETITAPIAQGQVLGKVEIRLGEELIYQGDVAALQAVERAGFFKRFMDWLTMFFTSLFS